MSFFDPCLNTHQLFLFDVSFRIGPCRAPKNAPKTGRRTCPTTFFDSWNGARYSKTGHAHDIGSAQFLAKKTKAGHDKEDVEREKLHPVQRKRVLQQKSLGTLESLERC